MHTHELKIKCVLNVCAFFCKKKQLHCRLHLLFVYSYFFFITTSRWYSHFSLSPPLFAKFNPNYFAIIIKEFKVAQAGKNIMVMFSLLKNTLCYKLSEKNIFFGRMWIFLVLCFGCFEYNFLAPRVIKNELSLFLEQQHQAPALWRKIFYYSYLYLFSP